MLFLIGEQAERRGRFHRAARLYQQAADRGNTDALWRLARLLG